MSPEDTRAVVAMTSYLHADPPRLHDEAVREELRDYLAGLPRLSTEIVLDLVSLGDPEILGVMISHPDRPDLAALDCGTLDQEDILDHLDIEDIRAGWRVDAFAMLRPFSSRENLFPAMMLAAFRMTDPRFGRHILEHGTIDDLLAWLEIETVTEECAPEMAPLAAEIYARAARGGGAAHPLARGLLESDHRKGVALLLLNGLDFGAILSSGPKLWPLFSDLASAHGRMKILARLPEDTVLAAMERDVLRRLFTGG